MRSLIAFLLCFPILVISGNPDYRVIRQASQSPSSGDKPIRPKEIFKAIEKDDVEKVRMLIDRGADVNSKNVHGNTPLQNAASNGRSEIVKLLIDRGANVNAIDDFEETPLHLAAFFGHDETVKLLIDRGAIVNAIDGFKRTPLHRAAHFDDNDETVKILIERGADVNTQDNEGSTPLHSVAANGRNEILKILIDRGANVNATNNRGSSPLHSAASGGHDETVKILIERGADVDSKTIIGGSSLHYVATKGRNEMVRVLVDLGANVNAVDDKGDSPLYNAVWGGNNETVKILIERGADVNHKNNEGWTPLHKAADAGHLETIQILLAKGANLNARTKDGKHAAELALKGGFMDIVQLLRENRPAKQACKTYMQLSEDNILAIGSTQVMSEEEFPWMAALGYVHHIGSKYTVVFKCGGTIISEYFILTAVHCVKANDLPSVARLGKISLLDDDDTPPENPNIKEFFRHSEYSEKTRKNDIALIRLVISIFFGSSIAPACLQIDVRDESADVKLFATGWGITDKNNRTSTSNVLRKTQLTTMPLAECNARLLEYNRGKNDEALEDGLSQGQYCTFHSKGHDSCSGDSGGPIQYFKNSRFATVVGIISFGVGLCGSGLPSVNTRVAYYLDWIESVVWPNGFTLN